MKKEISKAEMANKAAAVLSMATAAEWKSLLESFEAKQKAKDENG